MLGFRYVFLPSKNNICNAISPERLAWFTRNFAQILTFTWPTIHLLWVTWSEQFCFLSNPAFLKNGIKCLFITWQKIYLWWNDLHQKEHLCAKFRRIPRQKIFQPKKHQRAGNLGRPKLPAQVAGQSCRPKLPAKVAGQSCWPKLPYKCIVWMWLKECMYEYMKNKQKEWPPATRPFLLFSIKP